MTDRAEIRADIKGRLMTEAGRRFGYREAVRIFIDHGWGGLMSCLDSARLADAGPVEHPHLAFVRTLHFDIMGDAYRAACSCGWEGLEVLCDGLGPAEARTRAMVAAQAHAARFD